MDGRRLDRYTISSPEAFGSGDLKKKKRKEGRYNGTVLVTLPTVHMPIPGFSGISDKLLFCHQFATQD